MDRQWRHLSGAVEADDVVTDAGGAARLDLVQVPEEVESGAPPPVVQLALGQYPQQGALAGVHVPQHRQPHVDELQEVNSQLKRYAIILENLRVGEIRDGNCEDCKDLSAHHLEGLWAERTMTSIKASSNNVSQIT